MKNFNAPIPVNLAGSLGGTRLTLALLASLMVSLAPLASAGTIGISGGNLIVGTEPGDGNQSIIVSVSGPDLVISGVNFDIVTPGCRAGTAINCALAGFNQLTILGGAGDDAISLAAISAPTFSTLILGGPGADVLIGSGGNDTILGGLGDDIVNGGPGIDTVSGGPGNNIVFNGERSFIGPDPVITPLPRPASNAPEPGAQLLLGTGLVLLALAVRGLRGRALPRALLVPGVSH